jgi:hypothetical protein
MYVYVYVYVCCVCLWFFYLFKVPARVGEAELIKTELYRRGKGHSLALPNRSASRRLISALSPTFQRASSAFHTSRLRTGFKFPQT